MKNIRTWRNGSSVALCAFVFVAVVITVMLFATNPPRGTGYGFFSLVSWNVHDALNPDPDTYKINYLRNKRADVVGIQEDFCKHVYDGLRADYGYGATYNDCNNWPFSTYRSGLSILSRVTPFSPLQNISFSTTAFRQFNNCTGFFDCQATKGFVLTKLFVPVQSSSGWIFEMPVHYYDLHLNSGRGSSPRNVRQAQLNQLRDFMNIYSVGMSVIVSGDFNCIYQDTLDRNVLLSFITSQNLTMANNPNQFTSGDSTIDYVLYRTGDARELLVASCEPDYSAHGLSDHDPLVAQFSYSANYDAFPDLVITDILSFEYDPLGDGTGKGIARVVVKNEGPAAVTVASAVYMTIQTIKYNNGVGTCPPLSPGQSVIIEVEYYTPQGPIPPEYTDVNIVVTADRTTDPLLGGRIKENNEGNNTLTKWVPIQWTNF